MGQYINLSDVEKYVGKPQLIWLSQTGREDASTIDVVKVNNAISYAEQDINDRLYTARYRVPLEPLATGALEVVKNIAIGLAIWNMARGIQVGDSTQVEQYKDFYREIQDKLTGYATGSRTLQCRRWFANQSSRPVPLTCNQKRRFY